MLADGPEEESGKLENRRADLSVAKTIANVAKTGFQMSPARRLVR
jgi:hypothetical protein